MSEVRAASAGPGSAGVAPRAEERGGGWSRQRWLTTVALVFAAQVAVIFALGERHVPAPRAVGDVPRLTLAAGSSELLALDDPTLFVLPQPGDFAFAGQGRTNAAPRQFLHWTEPPLPPLLAAGNLGAIFAQFMRTNAFAAPANSLKLRPRLSEPPLPALPVLAGNSSLRIEGELAGRKLLTAVDLTNWPYADVIEPSRVLVLVNAAGQVVSAVLLPPASPIETASHYHPADASALALARHLRFAPAPGLAVGRLIFEWRTVLPPTTNAPAILP